MKMCSRDIYLSFTVFSFYLHSLILLKLNKESRRSDSELQKGIETSALSAPKNNSKVKRKITSGIKQTQNK